MPNKIIDGGIIGISLILDYLTPNIWWLSFSTLVVILNIPFMYSGYKQIGKTFMLSSAFGIVALAFIESTLHAVPPFTTEPILATVFGGLILGLGVGLVIRHGINGRNRNYGYFINEKLPFSVGEFVMFVNLFILRGQHLYLVLNKLCILL